MDDDRFKHIATDPRFRGVPRTERKVRVDERFRGMFEDKKFKLKYTMDKRGRPLRHSTTEDLKKYYDLSSSDDDDQESSKGDFKEKASEKTGESTSDDDGEDSEAEVEESKAKDVDLARGIGNVQTSSSEDDEDSEGEGSDAVPEVEWGELDKDAPRSDDATHRLALCNLDWDKIQARDLFVLLHSFKPSDGVVRSVKVYLSDFGRERLAEEEKHGPKIEGTKKADKTGGDEECDREALRKYELSKLKYYYAIAECDSVDTADHLYRELDGREYEASGTCLDLRFVPDDMTFEDEPKSVADSLPDASSYEPITFINSALQSANVRLTWDQDDPRRAKAIRDAFAGDTGTDLQVYLASSSSEDEEAQGGDRKVSVEEQVRKYRELLNSLDKDKEKDKDEEKVEMEVTWNPDLNKTVEDMVKRKQQQPSTPFEEFLQKRKEKKKMKKRNLQEEEPEQDAQDEERAFSDDSLPEGADVDDDFFGAEEGDRKKASKKKKAKRTTKEAAEPDERTKAELELLLMDEEDGRRHFDLRKLVEEGKASKKKSKKQRKTENSSSKAGEQDFQVQLEDPRFSALYESHHFNLDPTDPRFKKTKAMEAILSEKRRRRTEPASPTAKRARASPAPEDAESGPTTSSLSSLANSVRTKVQILKNRKKLKG